MKLYQFAFSHFCEKAAWALDFLGLTYTKENLTPFAHVAVTLPKSGKSSVPLLEGGKHRVSGSSEIIDYAIEKSNNHELSSGLDQAEIKKWESRLDNDIGKPLQTLIYRDALREPVKLGRLWGGSNAMARASIQWASGAIGGVLSAKYKINDQGISSAEKRLDSCLADLDQLFTKQKFLLGNKFSRADITMAALLYPLALPAEHPHADYLYEAGIEELMQPMLVKFRDHRVVNRVREMYSEFRG